MVEWKAGIPIIFLEIFVRLHSQIYIVDNPQKLIVTTKSEVRDKVEE